MIVSETWIIFIGIGLFLLLIGFLCAIVFLIYAALEIRKTAASITDFLKRTDERLAPVLFEAEQTLKSFRVVSDDAGVVTGNVKKLSYSIYEVAENVRAISAVISGFRSGMTLRASGLRAGLKAAFAVLLNEIKERRF
ncbi:MAG: DUF948 domain-containing protein [Nitrospirae bacterium]|nr:MAG: DUF948 domain-containing protein [Nitrospirota bacterium]